MPFSQLLSMERVQPHHSCQASTRRWFTFNQSSLYLFDEPWTDERLSRPWSHLSIMIPRPLDAVPKPVGHCYSFFLLNNFFFCENITKLQMSADLHKWISYQKGPKSISRNNISLNLKNKKRSHMEQMANLFFWYI